MLVNENAGLDTVWRSAPRSLWAEIIGELCDGFMYAPHYQSVEEGEIDSDSYGFKHVQYNGENADPDDMERFLPEKTFRPQWEVGQTEREEEQVDVGEDRFRTGILLMGRRNAANPLMEQNAEERYMENRKEYGPLPYAKWEALTDTAVSPYDETAWNIRLPKTRKERDSQMEELRQKLHLLYLGGVGNSNLKQIHGPTSSGMETGTPESEDCEFETISKVKLKTPVSRTPPLRVPESSASTTERGNFRIGTKEEEEEEQQPSASSIYVPGNMGSQQRLNAVVGKSIVEEKI